MTLWLNAVTTIGEGDRVEPGGRLGLVGGSPRSCADVNGTHLYYSPDCHNKIEIWDGANWVKRTFSVIDYAPGWTNGQCHDIFAEWSAGNVNLFRTTWASAMARGATVALARQDGRLVLGTDPTRLYLGTVYVPSGNKLWDQDASRCVVNRYNQLRKRLMFRYSSVAWTFTSTAWRAVNLASAYWVEYVQAFTDEETAYVVHHATGRPAAGGGIYAGIGDTSTTVNSAQANGSNFINTQFITYQGLYAFRGQEGYHYFSALERSYSTVSATASADPASEAIDMLIGSCVC